MRTAVLAVLSLFLPLAASAATLVSSRTFNGAFGSSDTLRGAVAAPGGGYYLTGETFGPNNHDIWVLRLDAGLNVTSSITLNGPANGYDFGAGIGLSTGGEVYVVGATSVTSVGMKAWIGRFSPSLALVSSHTYMGGQAPANDTNTSFDGIAFEPGGDFFVAGDGYVNPGDPWSSVMLFRYSPALTLVATAAYNNGFASEYGSSILRVASGDIYVGGGVAPAALTSANGWIGKFDGSMVLQATVTFAGAGGNTDQVRGLALGSNGDIYATGIINNSGVTVDAWFGRYTSALAPVSNFSLAGVAATNDQGNAIVAGWPGYLFAAGSLSQAGQAENLLVAQLSQSAFAVTSTTTFNSSGANTDMAHAVVVDSAANNALLVGHVNSGADGWAGLFSFNTPGPVAPSGFAGSAQSSTSIQWTWTDNSSDETGFRVISGTNNVSGDLAANTTGWLQTSLSPNAAQTLFARAYNSTGTADSASVTRYTLADPPSSVSITFWGSSVTLSWPALGNPASTVWSVERGTNGVSYPLQLYLSSAAATFTGDAGLATNTSYYYRVRAMNGDGVYSFHANASGVVYTGGVPAAPSGLAGAAQSVSAIQWSWTDNSSDETGFRVMTGTVSLSGDLAANTTVWVQPGMGVNASSGSVYVRAFNSTGTADSGTLARYSLAQAPTALAAAAVHLTSASFTWSAGSNPLAGVTSFTLQASTSSSFSPAVSTPSIAAGAVLAGLSAGTTYFARVQAANFDGIATAFSSTVSFVTSSVAVSSPAAPSGFSGAPLSSASIRWSWTDNSTDETGFRVLSGTISLSGDLPAGATQWVQTGLSSSTGYGPYLAQAFNSTGTANSGTASTSTLAGDLLPPAAPSGFAGTALSSTSIRWTWTDNAANEDGYRVMSGTVSLSGNLAAGTTQWVQTGLAPSTGYGPYHAQVYNSSGTADSATSSQTTLGPNPPAAPSGFAGTALSSTSIRWTWNDNAVNEDGYRVMSGTVSLSGNLAAGTTQWVQTGLAPSTAYGPYHAQVYNSSGTADSGTASQTTQGPNPPAAPSGFAGTALSSTSIRWSWTDNAINEDGYRVMSGTINLSGNLAIGTTQWVQTGLTASTSYGPYFARVYNSSATADSASASTTTLAPPTVPVAPTGFAGTALGQTSILWSWNDNDGNEDGYRVMSGTTNLSGDLPAGSTTWTQTGLARNTSYGPYFARAYNTAGTADSGTASRKTLAGPPGGSSAPSFSASAATITWTLNGNPAGTLAEVQRSTDDASYAVFYSSAVTSVRDGTLIGCTSYYYKVRHFNGDAVATAFDATVLVRTPNTVPAAPASITAEAVSGGRVAFGWAGSPTEGVTGYRLYSDGGTGTFNFGSPLAVFTSTESSWTSGVLASSASYAFSLRAVHRCGVEETSGVLAAAASTATLASVRAAIKNPEAGKRVAGNRVTVMAELTAGTPTLVSQVVFQFRASTAAPWADLPAANPNHPNPDLTAPYFVHWDVTALAQGPYQLRAVAYDGFGVADPAPGAITVIVDAAAPDISENVVAGEIRKQQSVNNAVVNVIAAGGIDAADALAKVVLPPGAVNTTTVTVTVETNPTITTASPAGFSAIGSSLRIDLSNGQHLLSGGQTACLTFSYPNTVTNPNALSIMSLDEATGVWSRDFATTVNASSRTVTGCTPHFSVFAVFQGVATATLLDGVRLYPNPYKPNSGNPNEGKPFSVGDDTTGIVIDNLPARVTIEIFSLAGRRVAKFDTNASGGKIRWNARNSDGRDAASGGYFAVISSPGMKPIVKKFIIIR